MLIALLLMIQAAPESFRLADIKDPLDDGITRAALVAHEHEYLSLICPKGQNQPSVVLEFPRYVGNVRSGILAGGQQVDYRIDSRAPETAMWDSNGHTVSAIRPDQEPVKFMLKLKGSRKIYMRTYDLSQNAVEMTFDYEEPTSAIDDVLAHCGFGADGKRLKHKR